MGGKISYYSNDICSIIRALLTISGAILIVGSNIYLVMQENQAK